jgi:predicted transposase/invertase (TIGR01784 family)
VSIKPGAIRIAICFPEPRPSGMLAAVKPPTPHDSLFRDTFSNPEHARGLLRHMMKRSLAARFDWSTLRLIPGSFVGPTLRGRHCDLLYGVRCGDKEVLVYLLLEHQSTTDPLMPFRLLVYMVRVWERYVREHPHTTRLPAIMPMVVHHSREGWTSPTSFEELFDLEPDMLNAVRANVPSFKFLLDDLRVAGDASVRARAMSALGRMALLFLRHSSEPQKIVERVARWLDLLREIRATPEGGDALERLWRYLIVISETDEPEELVEHLQLVVGEAYKEEIVTAGEKLMERGGRNTLRDVLLEQLGERYGALPEPTIARVLGADLAQLKRWAKRVLTAPTLDDALAEG